MKKLLILLIYLIAVAVFGCKKSDLTLLQGQWSQTVSVPEGMMTTTITFEPDQRYSIESYILAPDHKSIIQTCPLKGTYTAKLAFRVDGQTFDWIESGKIKGGSLILNDKIHSKKLNFDKI